MSSHDVRVPVLVADRALPTGTRLTATDVTVAEVDLPAEQMERYVSGVEEIEGLLLSRSLAAGELVPANSLTGAADPRRVVTIPIEAEHAAGGILQPGDLVDVWATFGQGRNPVTKLIVGSVEVVDVVRRGGLVGDEALSGISIAIPPEAAPRVVLALRAGDIDLLLSDGASSSARDTMVVGEL